VSRRRLPHHIITVVDAAPHARRCFSDAFGAYRELRRRGAHRAMYKKSPIQQFLK
jgi:hypothetical protein